ncbi:odorant receptor 67c-like [Dendroctonus ponderosae]|uniref:odorant receptor 67c-like n=1 Tax=Dendroctonus ponderosae TaxID=77166 RepID=UPI002035B3E7|nr:odorant receptor 67c-like [Dendroctonus ponderosae]
MMENKSYRIMQLHTNLLKCLFLWPVDTFSPGLNSLLMYGSFCISMCCGIPIISAAGYQFYVGIEDVNILLEALIGVYDIIGNTVTYVCFLRKQRQIQEIIDDIKDFFQYCGYETVRKIDSEIMRHTKYFLFYVTVSVILNLAWPMLSVNNCLKSRRSDFYIKHDPCGMPTQNLYPFEASEGIVFWVLYIIEAIFCYHTCCFFSLATVIVIGFLKHITAQLKCCAYKFEHICDYMGSCKNDENVIIREFVHLIKYHQRIIKYAEKVFGIFDVMIIVYIGVTSFTLAIIGYQIAIPKTNLEDRIRYTMLLIGWVLLFYSICFYGQQVRDESMKVGEAIYKSEWYQHQTLLGMKTDIMFVMRRTLKPLDFKATLLGEVSLIVFVAVMKRAYQLFTLLLTVTEDGP